VIQCRHHLARKSRGGPTAGRRHIHAVS